MDDWDFRSWNLCSPAAVRGHSVSMMRRGAKSQTQTKQQTVKPESSLLTCVVLISVSVLVVSVVDRLDNKNVDLQTLNKRTYFFLTLKRQFNGLRCLTRRLCFGSRLCLFVRLKEAGGSLFSVSVSPHGVIFLQRSCDTCWERSCVCVRVRACLCVSVVDWNAFSK